MWRTNFYPNYYCKYFYHFVLFFFSDFILFNLFLRVSVPPW